MGYRSRGTRFVVSCPDQPGTLAKDSQLFDEEDANMDNIAVYHSEERGTELVVKATGTVSVETMSKVLSDNGFKLVHVVQTDENGNRTVFVKNGESVR